MAQVVLPASLKPFTGDQTEFDIEVKNIRDLFRKLSELYPALQPHLDAGFAVAIDGEIFQDDWLQPISADSEVYLIPKIGGGSSSPT